MQQPICRFLILVSVVIVTSPADGLVVPNALNSGDPYHLAFVTAGTREARTSNYISTYNQFVNDEAALNPWLTGTNDGVKWFVIGSTQRRGESARDNALVDPNAPVYLMNGGTKIADGFDDIWDGTIDNPLNINQFGVSVVGVDIWTGSSNNGKRLYGPAPGGGSLGEFIAGYGRTSLTNGGWISNSTKPTQPDGVLAPKSFYALSQLLVKDPAACDFNFDGACGLIDINLMFFQGDLVAGASVNPGNKFDMNSDSSIDGADITEWLDQAGTKSSYSAPFLRGDTDGLDNLSPTPRTVDITDFQNFLGGFTGAGSSWEVGNFDGDGDVDITDFSNLFLPSFAATGGSTYGPGQSVPEPSTVLLLGLAGVCLACFSRLVDHIAGFDCTP